MSARLLVVDDDTGIRDGLAERFRARGFDVATAASGAEALERARSGPDVVLLDLQLPRGDGLWVLSKLAEEEIETTVIVLTAYGTVARAVEAMKAGAYDFLEKPFEPARVEETVRRALERHTLRRANRALRLAGHGTVRGFVVADPRMEEVVRLARKAAASDATVLLGGESGTGKEVLARAIHEWSGRAEGPFVAVNCVALAETLLESELFGHEKGAFTGAIGRKPGKIELAGGGTLFLDEIGDISPAFQAKLLRVLQEKAFERVGGTQTLRVDVRVVSATNQDLKAMVAAGRFREDLFYRLHVIAIHLPPLRERALDVPALAARFVEASAADAKRPAVRLSAAALEAIRAYPWPGNVRELKNAIERAVVLCEGDAVEPEDLPPDVLLRGGAPLPAEGFHARVEAFRRQVILDALAECGGNRTKAADRLGLQRTYLSRLIRQYGV